MKVIDSRPNCTGACETMMGCDCHPMHRAYSSQFTPDFVMGPTQPADLDDPAFEPEQDMVPAPWLAWVFMAAFAALLAAVYLLQTYGPEIIGAILS